MEKTWRLLSLIMEKNRHPWRKHGDYCLARKRLYVELIVALP
jgi:hypothetical protein